MKGLPLNYQKMIFDSTDFIWAKNVHCIIVAAEVLRWEFQIIVDHVFFVSAYLYCLSSVVEAARSVCWCRIWTIGINDDSNMNWHTKKNNNDIFKKPCFKWKINRTLEDSRLEELLKSVEFWNEVDRALLLREEYNSCL